MNYRGSISAANCQLRYFLIQKTNIYDPGKDLKFYYMRKTKKIQRRVYKPCNSGEIWRHRDFSI